MATSIADRPRAAARGKPGILQRLDRLLVGRRALLAAAVVYLGYALFVTWPLATNVSGLLSAPNLLEDGAGSTSYFAYLVAHHMSPFLPGHMSGLNAPAGTSVAWALNLAQAPSYLLWWLMALGFGPVAGANLFMLLGFVLSGVSMFAFAHRLFGSRIVALLAGFAFAFYPFAVSAASVHYVFVHGWPIVLCLWRLTEMIDRPDRRNGLLAGFATAFAMWWNPYYELFGGFALATMVVVCLAVGYKRTGLRPALRATGYALLPVAALGVFFAVLLKLGGGLSSVGTVPRPISQVYGFSAHLGSYLLPGPYNPLVGHTTGTFLRQRLGIADVWDSAIYPGYVVVVLAVAGFVRAVRSMRAGGGAALADIRTVAVLAAGAVAAVAFISSGAPTVSLLGITIPLPSGFLYRITPTWQTFARFVMLLEPALIIMMAAELARARRVLSGRRAVAVFAIIAVLLGVDLWARPPHRTVSTTPPPAYAWLHAHPGGIVADYPIDFAYNPASALATFWAAYDGHPLFQGFGGLTTSETMKLDLADLSSPHTAGELAGYHVRYIVVHGGTPGGDPAQLRKLGYRLLLRNRRSGSLWEVTSRPAATSVDTLSGFDPTAGSPRFDFRLLVGSGALILRARHCSVCTGTVSFSMGGRHRAFSLSVRDAATGRTLSKAAVPAVGSIRVRIPHIRLVNGQAQLELRTAPSADGVFGLRSARFTLDRG